ncbi:Uncharacterised protein [uncultured Ruminococcus sp.]|nr:Uncharacterised protein [uncultured Ruminococcus sp.]
MAGNNPGVGANPANQLNVVGIHDEAAVLFEVRRAGVDDDDGGPIGPKSLLYGVKPDRIADEVYRRFAFSL